MLLVEIAVWRTAILLQIGLRLFYSAEDGSFAKNHPQPVRERNAFGSIEKNSYFLNLESLVFKGLNIDFWKTKDVLLLTY